jgi:prevent-host-death family protein
MKVASVADVKAKLSAYLQEAEDSGPVVVTRNGKAVAVIVAPADDDDLEGILLSRSPRFRRLLDKSRASIVQRKGITHDDFWESARKGKVRAP